MTDRAAVFMISTERRDVPRTGLLNSTQFPSRQYRFGTISGSGSADRRGSRHGGRDDHRNLGSSLPDIRVRELRVLDRSGRDSGDR